jgi:ABC-2 type transport system permease protein
MSDKRRKYRVTFTVATVLLSGVALFLISVLGNFTGARADLTSDKLYTLAPAAARILKDLEVPVQVRLYITPSDKMPTAYNTLERDITEQLNDYARISDGKLQFSVHNPQDDKKLQEELIGKDIRPFQVQSVDKDEIGVKLVWCAMTIGYKDYPEEVVPRILPENVPNLETLVIVPIYRLTREKAPKVAVFAPKPEMDQQMAMMYLQRGQQPPEPPDNYSMIMQLLQQEHYSPVRVDLTAASPIPADADVLLVLNPANLNPRQAFEINRALGNGVPVFMAVQAHEYGYQPGPRGGWSISGRETPSGLDAMLGGFGLGVSKAHFFDSNLETLNLPREINLGGMRMQTSEPVQAPIQIRVTEDQFKKDLAITNRINQLLYLWGTPVTLDNAKMQQASLTSTTLMTSSSNCWQADFLPVPLSDQDVTRNGHTMLGPQPLAILVEGLFPDTFAASGPPPWPAEGEGTAPSAGNPAPLRAKPGRLILVGSSKMFDNNIIQGGENALLLLNGIDYLAGSEALLSIRAKSMTARTIRPVATGEKALWRFLTIFLVPILIAAYGVVRQARRNRESARYRRELSRRPAA